MGERTWPDVMHPPYFAETVTSDEAQFFYQDYNYVDNNIILNLESGQGVNNEGNMEYLPGTQILTSNETDSISNMDQIGLMDVSGHPINGLLGEYATQSGVESNDEINQQQRPIQIPSPVDSTHAKSNTIKTCRVCGDKALGYNFNVITCESCKAFFRRNALKKKDFRCPSRSNCNITISSRRYCQKCRLRKCFEVGMKPEYIMTDAQRAEKRRRLLSRSGASCSPNEQSQHSQDDEANSCDDAESGSDQGAVPVEGKVEESDGRGIAWTLATQGPQVETMPETGFQMNQESLHSTVDHTAGCVQNSPQPSSVESISSNNGSSVVSEDDTVEITIRVPKTALFGIMFNNGDNKGQAMALGQVMLSCMGGNAPAAQPIADNGPEFDESVNNGDSANQEKEEVNETNWLVPVSRKPSALGELTSLDLDALDSLASSMDFDWQLPVLSSPISVCLDLKFAKLEELSAIEQWRKWPFQPPPIYARTADEFTVDDLSTMMYYFALRYTRQYSQLSAFKQLPVEDQQTLIKSCINEVSTLRILRHTDLRTELIESDYPGQDFIEVALVKRVRGGVYHEFKAMVASFPEKWRRDESLFLILTALVLFNPDIPNLINRGAVEAQRRVYLQLFKDYLENTYGTEESSWAYEYLLARLNTLPIYTRHCAAHVFFELDPRTFEIVQFQASGFV